MTAYYNEIDPVAAQWLRNLISVDLIADGYVDERSVIDVKASELAGFTQCHFFAGIGIWSFALRQAGWPDDRPVWTGSCPCQPFSAAGKRGGFDDARHLWPTWHALISECSPVAVFGEQVASTDGLAWLDAVHTDLEASGYACGAIDTCAAGFGAPHIRQRLYFMAHAGSARCAEQFGGWNKPEGLAKNSGAVSVAHADNAGLERRIAMRQRADQCAVGADGVVGGLADPISIGVRPRGPGSVGSAASSVQGADRQRQWFRPDAGASHDDVRPRPGPTNGHWAAADWLYCRDDKWRPVEPGTFPLAHGVAGRVGRLRAYGNGLCAAQATEFIRAVLDS